MPEGDGLPGSAGHAQLYVAREILTKIDHRLSVGGGKDAAAKALLLDDRHAFGRRERGIAKWPHRDLVPVVDLLQASVVHLAKLQIVLPNRPALACLPLLVADQNRAAAELKLA